MDYNKKHLQRFLSLLSKPTTNKDLWIDLNMRGVRLTRSSVRRLTHGYEQAGFVKKKQINGINHYVDDTQKKTGDLFYKLLFALLFAPILVLIILNLLK